MKKTAYIFMEFQKDFLDQTGKLNVIKEKDYLLKNAKKILQFARKNNQPIVHVHLMFFPGYEELRKDINGVLALVKEAKAFQKGSEGVKPIEEFLPQKGETHLFKNSISAFEGTNLDIHLKEMEISDVVFVGLLSNICIESSIRDAYDKGYRVVAIQDAMATIDEQIHQHTIKNTLPLFSNVCTTDEFFQAQ